MKKRLVVWAVLFSLGVLITAVCGADQSREKSRKAITTNSKDSMGAGLLGNGAQALTRPYCDWVPADPEGTDQRKVCMYNVARLPKSGQQPPAQHNVDVISSSKEESIAWHSLHDGKKVKILALEGQTATCRQKQPFARKFPNPADPFETLVHSGKAQKEAVGCEYKVKVRIQGEEFDRDPHIKVGN